MEFTRLLRKAVFDFEAKKVLFPEVTGFGRVIRGPKLCVIGKLFLLMGYGGLQGILVLMEMRIVFDTSLMSVHGFEWFSDLINGKF